MPRITPVMKRGMDMSCTPLTALSPPCLSASMTTDWEPGLQDPVVPVIRSRHAPAVTGAILSSPPHAMVTSMALYSVRRGMVSSLCRG
jgi:hypothetical protein